MNYLKQLAALLLWGAAAAASAQAPLRIGVTAGVAAESIENAAEEAKKQGLNVKVIEFSDYTTPNVALEAGDLDANYFQHQAFLDSSIKARGYKLKSVAIGVVSNLGLYSTRFKRLQDLPDGARVAISNDATNQARGLDLLAQAGLVRLSATAGAFPTVHDVTANPKKLKFVEVEGIQITRSLDDVDAAVVLPHALVRSGKAELANQGLFYARGDPSYWAVRFVVRSEKPEDPRLRQFIRIYQGSAAVRAAICSAYASNDKLYGLSWLDQQK